MAFRRPAVLPTLALAAALGASALATTAAAEHAATHPAAGSHSATGFPASYGNVKDWNTMVPEGGRQTDAAY